MYNWKARIVQNAYWKQIAAEYDKNIPWHLPKVAATDQQISAAERAADFTFPQEYKDFLLHANGWPGFYFNTDLFGTPDFVDGAARRACVREDLQAFMRHDGFGPDDYICIGASPAYPTLFILLSTRAPKLPGGVIWYAHEEIDRYRSFSDFFTDMIACNSQIGSELQEKAAASKPEGS